MGLQLPELSELSELSVSGYLATWLPGSLIALWLPGSQVAWSQGGQKRSRAALRIPGRGCQVWRQAGRRHSRGRILRIQARDVIFIDFPLFLRCLPPPQGVGGGKGGKGFGGPPPILKLKL